MVTCPSTGVAGLSADFSSSAGDRFGLSLDKRGCCRGGRDGGKSTEMKSIESGKQ
jgi:hypothetical protein